MVCVYDKATEPIQLSGIKKTPQTTLQLMHEGQEKQCNANIASMKGRL